MMNVIGSGMYDSHHTRTRWLIPRPPGFLSRIPVLVQDLGAKNRKILSMKIYNFVRPNGKITDVHFDLRVEKSVFSIYGETNRISNPPMGL